MEEEDPWKFLGWNSDLSVNQQFIKIHNSLLENQKYYDRFRAFHVELKEMQREASFLEDDIKDELKLRIGKKPRLLSYKFYEPDLYSVIGAVARKLSDISTTINSKINTEKAVVKVDFDKFKINSAAELEVLKRWSRKTFNDMKLILSRVLGICIMR